MPVLTQPIIHDLVLLGGGHSHAIALKLLGMSPLVGVRLTLITDVYHTPYSGMLPGYVAGLYSFDQCHIDLRPLSRFAQAQFIADRAIGLDLQHNRVLCANHPPIAFDLLSIDIGSTPNIADVPGAREVAIPVKPISHFLTIWDQLVTDLTRSPQQSMRLGIVGGGAGGVELALNIHARLRQIYQAACQPSSHLEIHLFHRGRDILEGSSAWIRHRLRSQLMQRGVHLHLLEEVIEVQPDRVICQSGLVVPCDRLFWVTQAAATPWIQASGLATDSHGFIEVNDDLQSTSHPQVFAAGDIATIQHHPRPKAGVFAVRQGKPLAENLCRTLLQKPLQSYVPQRQWLSLIGMGDRSAIATRGKFGLGPYPLIWRWKDQIDRRFMERFTNLQPMPMQPSVQSHQTKSLKASKNADSDASIGSMHCAGCGSKVGSATLERALQRIRQEHPWMQRDDIVVGLDAPDDAAVIRVDGEHLLVQTIDYFSAIVEDPFLFGQITANHCLSDIFAMGATPQSALAIATLPYASMAKTEEMLYQLLCGATQVLSQAQATLIGGHTIEGGNLAFGLTCNGLIRPEQLLLKQGMQPGQRLIVTKALGTGVLFAADMRLKAKGRWIESAIASMLLSNQAAAECLQQYHATACTDVTGFGLVGHLLEMIRASHVAVELDGSALPVLAGVDETLRQGIVSSLHAQNVAASQEIRNRAAICDRPLYPILFDPQTSGGLLASVPAEQASACLSALQQRGYAHSRIIGHILPLSDHDPPITIKL